MQQTINIPSKQIIDSDQYSLIQILGLWALVAIPMGILTWVIAPALIPYSPFHPGITFWLLIIVGLVWQFVVSMVVMYRELEVFNWKNLRERTWLVTPKDPQTNTPQFKLFWWLIPAILFNGLVVALGGFLDAPMHWLFPFLQPQSYMDIIELATPEFEGAWWLLGIVLLSCVFNYFLGEEFFFHGVLLPKMRGVFGKWDWVANAILFGLYHLHKPWAILSIIISALSFSLPSRRFKSNWMAVIVHGFEGLILIVVVFAVILGATG